VEKKKRTPIPEEVSDQLLFATDYTCCICRRPDRPLQIHHIDEDPSNNDISNLAVLCLDCHHKTQVHGGFGKRYTPGVVCKYREDWLRTVGTKRARQTRLNPDRASRAPMQRMSAEYARQHAQRLRTLYASFSTGIDLLHTYIEQLHRYASPPGNAPLLNEPLEQRKERLRPICEQAEELLNSTIPQIRIEPGAEHVCDLYKTFRSVVDQCVSAIDYEHTRSGFLSGLYTMFNLQQADKKFADLQTAIRDHLRRIDQLC
jgi:hypothetical protein